MAKKTKKKNKALAKKEEKFVRPTGARMHKKNLENGGRPTKFNQEIADQIIQYIMLGSYVETAAMAAGIHKHTFYEWLKRGAHDKAAKKTTQWSRFNDAVTNALGKSEQRDLLKVDKASERDWRAAAWKLERRAPRRWGPKAAMKIEGGDKEGFSDDEENSMHGELAKLVSKYEAQDD